MTTLEESFQEKRWRVPVTSLLTGKISRWEKGDGDWVQQGDTVCIIKPDAPGAKDFEVPAPASGYLGIEKRFAKPETWVWGGLLEEDRDIIAYIYTGGFKI